MGIPKDSHAGREWFERMMEERRSLDDPESFRQIRRGWCFGEESFREELQQSITEKWGRITLVRSVEKRRKSERCWTFDTAALSGAPSGRDKASDTRSSGFLFPTGLSRFITWQIASSYSIVTCAPW